MKQQNSSILGADFGFVVLLAAMLFVGVTAFVTADDDRGGAGMAVPVAGEGARLAGEVVTVEPYRIEVVGVRPKATAQGDARGNPAS